jgi:uncharacterized protein with HEPN domain
MDSDPKYGAPCCEKASVPHRSAKERLSDIAGAIAQIQSYVQGMTFETFERDLRTMHAVELNFIVIGEAARAVPKEFTEAHPEIPWAEMRGMRNVITHGYFTVSAAIIWETIQNDLPVALAPVRRLLDERND